MKRAGIARLISASICLSLTTGLGAQTRASNKAGAAPQTAGKINKSRSNRPKSAKSGKGVVAQFSQAMQLYDAGKFAEALVVFDRIHRTYPAHEPTTIQYAKTLYRLDRIPESYNLFARINPQYLDPETAYEYGYAFYVQNRFDGALFSFKRVPTDHPLYDLASYYAAMCAIRMKKYAEAEELLDKAVVLPDKLARSKTLYQKHVSSLRQIQEKADLERQTADEKQRIAGEQIKAKTQGKPGATPVAQPVAPAKYAHAGFYSVDRFAKLKIIQVNQSSDLHGFSRKNYNSQVGAFNFSQGPVAALPLKLDHDRQAAVGLQIDLALSSVTSEGIQERLVAYEDSREIVQNLTERTPKTTTNNGDIGGTAWIESPLPSGWWLGADGHMGFTYPDFKRGQRYGFRGATGKLGWMKASPTSWTIEITGTHDQIVDSEAEPVTAQTISDNTASVSFKSATTLKLGAKYVFYDYKLPLLPGPDTSTSGSLTAEQKFPLGFAVSLTGTIEQQSNYIARNLASVGSASADGQIKSGVAKIKASPFDWITVSAKHTVSQSKWTVKQSDRAEAFKASTPDYSETTEIIGSINFNF